MCVCACVWLAVSMGVCVYMGGWGVYTHTGPSSSTAGVSLQPDREPSDISSDREETGAPRPSLPPHGALPCQTLRTPSLMKSELKSVPWRVC